MVQLEAKIRGDCKAASGIKKMRSKAPWKALKRKNSYQYRRMDYESDNYNEP